VGADQAPELVGECEDDVEVRHRQEQLALALEPARRGVVTATWACSIATGMEENVFLVAMVAHGDMPTHILDEIDDRP